MRKGINVGRNIEAASREDCVGCDSPVTNISAVSDPIFVSVPAGIDFKALAAAQPPPPRFNPDVAALLLDTLVRRRHPDQPHAMINLKAEYLRRCHRDYAKYMSWLASAGVIESDGRYEIGRKCLGYRLTENYRSRRLSRYELTATKTKHAHRRRIDRAMEANCSQPVDVVKGTGDSRRPSHRRVESEVLVNPLSDKAQYPFSASLLLSCPPVTDRNRYIWLLTHWYNYDAPSAEVARRMAVATVERIAPDLWRTMRHLQHSLLRVSLAPDWASFLAKEIARGGTTARLAKNQRRKLGRFQQSIRLGIPRFTRNTTNARLDTDLTNLRKDLRRFVRLDPSGPLTSLDVKSMQPYLLIRLLREAEQAGLVRNGTAAEWVSAVCDGDIYQTLARELTISRNSAKQLWFRVLFGHNKAEFPAKNYFERRYPEVARYVSIEKRRHKRDLAVKLQRMESLVMLERIGPRLADLQIPCLTVHDSLLVLSADMRECERIMTEELHAYVGQKPVIVVT